MAELPGLPGLPRPRISTSVVFVSFIFIIYMMAIIIISIIVLLFFIVFFFFLGGGGGLGIFRSRGFKSCRD